MSGLSDMHHIQKDIIISLAKAAPQRFTDLHPPRIPNNTFCYHLKKLIETGYIEVGSSGYSPTRKALKAMPYSKSLNDKQTSVPATMIAVYITDSMGRVLLVERQSQPFRHFCTLPSGLVHKGETMQAAARRKLQEKTGVVSKHDLEFANVLDYKYIEKATGDMFMHTIMFVYLYRCRAKDESSVLPELAKGELRWSSLKKDRVLPEVRTIANLVRDGRRSVYSVDYPEPVDIIKSVSPQGVLPKPIDLLGPKPLSATL